VSEDTVHAGFGVLACGEIDFTAALSEAQADPPPILGVIVALDPAMVD
jgi:hypothetical protein